MGFPTSYARGFGFQNFQDVHPTTPLPGDQVDAELNGVGASTAAIIAFLKGISRSDGRLANGAVGADQLAPDLSAVLIGYNAQASALLAASVGNIGTLPSTAALLSLFQSTVPLAGGSAFMTAGRAAAGDGGGCLFFYDNTDTSSSDNGGNIRVDGVGRRWKAIAPVYRPRLFGAAANGTTNDAAAINTMLAAAAATGHPCGFEGLAYRVDSTLTHDLSRVLVDLEGGTLDFTSLAASPGWAPTTTVGDPNIMAALHGAHPIRNGRIIGPSRVSGFSLFTPVAVTITGSPWICGITYENLGVHGFAVMHDIVSGDFFLKVLNCSYTGTTGNPSGWVLRSVGATNSGENMKISGLKITNTVGFYLETTSNANMEIDAPDISVDGCVYVATGGTLASPGTAAINARIKMGGHWEALTYTDYVVRTASSFIGQGLNQLLSGALAHVPFKSEAANVAPGIVLRDHQIVTDGTASFPGGHICDGTGRFEMDMKGLGNTFLFCGAVASNRVPNYALPNSGSLTTVWSGSPQYDASDKPTGATASCKLDGAHTQANFSTPCAPGQTASAQIQLKITTPGASDKVALIVNYLDGAGNTLTGTETDTATAAAYVAVQALNQVVAPPGTVAANVAVVYVPSAGGATVRFALPELQVY